ncbi:MAG: NTP transferase domain-containing protein [Fimbriimonadales bacterium]
MAHQDAVRRFSAIISAGGQAGDDLASLLGVREKCAAMYGGRSLAFLAAEAATGAGAEQVVVVCGDEVRGTLSGFNGLLALPGKNPVESARNGLDQLETVGDIVFLPGDLPLIRPQHVSDFAAALPHAEGDWLATGVASERDVIEMFGPAAEVGYVKLDQQRFAAASLSAASRGGFERALATLSQLSESRKSQLGMALRFGLADVVRFLLGRMTTDRAQRAGMRLFGSKSFVIKGCAPELVMDVDSAADWQSLPPT